MELYWEVHSEINISIFERENTRLFIWWQLPVPPKIRVCMWLLTKKRILTKVNLIKKGWLGNPHCHFCGMDEDVNHLFVKCSYTRKIWFWMGQFKVKMNLQTGPLLRMLLHLPYL
jgi:hypothetical protein